VSAAGRFLSFTDWEAGGNLAIYDLTTGQSRRLTGDGSVSSGPFAEASVPSPDGKSIVYAWRGETYDLRVVGLDGSKPRILRAGGDGTVRQSPLAWSPDSRHVLAEIVKADGTRDMMLVAAADGSAKLLKAIGKNPSPGGVFSPDGRYIAWATSEGFSLFELQTGMETPLIPDRSSHSVLGWAPDGKHILFSSERWGSADAWLVAVAGGKAQGEPMFVKKNWGFLPMGFTSSGAFYYAVNNTVGDVKIAEIDPVSGDVVSPPQSVSQRGNTWAPDWSPDGRFLAYIFALAPRRTVIVRSLDTGEEREYEAGERTIGLGASLRWVPDGKAVAVPVLEPGKGETLVRIDVQTGRVTSLMPLPAGVGFARFGFSPDGNTVFYVKPAVLQGENWSVVARDLTSGKETNIIERPGLYGGVVSPDGRRLVITVTEGKYQVLLVMPVSGGEPRELVRVDREKEYASGASPWWTPDGRYVAFLKGAKGIAPNELQVWRVEAEGGEPQRTGLTVGRQIGGLRPHPDGRRLASNDFKVNLEIWVMENFLPRLKVGK
jgi:Tol biopolymer transport system component